MALGRLRIYFVLFSGGCLTSSQDHNRRCLELLEPFLRDYKVAKLGGIYREQKGPPRGSGTPLGACQTMKTSGYARPLAYLLVFMV